MISAGTFAVFERAIEARTTEAQSLDERLKLITTIARFAAREDIYQGQLIWTASLKVAQQHAREGGATGREIARATMAGRQ